VITQTIVGWLATAFGAIVGLVPSPDLPAWFGVTPPWFLTAIDVANQMGGWFPLAAISQTVGFLLVVFVVTLALKVARIVVSVLSAGGGSAG
jgi:hypothetical protein